MSLPTSAFGGRPAVEPVQREFAHGRYPRLPEVNQLQVTEANAHTQAAARSSFLTNQRIE